MSQRHLNRFLQGKSPQMLLVLACFLLLISTSASVFSWQLSLPSTGATIDGKLPQRLWQVPSLSRLGVHVSTNTVPYGTVAPFVGAERCKDPAANWSACVGHGVRPSFMDLRFEVSGTVASRVRAIIQADLDAGYDSRAQHDRWWNSVCSAAAFTEVTRAWGIPGVTIGKVLDRLLAHDPPYISVDGGLLSSDSWLWMAAAYHLHAEVASHAYSFDDMAAFIAQTGIPIILGMKGGNVKHPWGHFVVMVGGDSTHAQIVDSSTWRMTSLPRGFFNGPPGVSGIINEPIWWSGGSIILTPV